MAYLPIHKREYYEMQGLRAEVLSGDEPVVHVVFTPGFVFGNTTPYSDAKVQAAKLLDRNYDRMRVIDLRFSNERVTELFIAYRKAGA